MIQDNPETPVEHGKRNGTMTALGASPSLLLDLAREEMSADRSAQDRIPAPTLDAPLPRMPDSYTPPFIPREYRSASFERFNPDIAGTNHERELSTALRTVKAWTKAARTGNRAMLALVGSQGNGKSTLLYSAVNALAREGIRIFSRPWYRLADDLRYGGPSPWVPSAILDAHDLRREMYRSLVVVIDEVRVTAGTAFDDTELAKFSCHAWDEGVAVMISTNVSPLSAVMGDAAADRYTVVTLTAPSRRQAV